VGKKKFNNQPFPYHHELELEVSTLTNLGVGLGRVLVPEIQNPESKIENSSKWVVMVPFTLPGERVKVRIYRNHKNFSEADLIEVLTPSPYRIDPKCPLFGRCGGCQYQHLTYAEQLKWKRQQVEELLKYMAGVEFTVAPVIASPKEFGYRSKITPHFNPPRIRNAAVTGVADPGLDAGRLADAPGSATPATAILAMEMPIGFLKASNRFELVDVPQCPIATPEINAKLPEVRARVYAKAANNEYERGATLLLRHAKEGVTTDYDAVIIEEIAQPDLSKPLRLHFLARDFFQNNPFILPAFTNYVRGQAAGSGAKFLVDAYCGSGLFALSCASAFEKVAGVELSASSVKFATENAKANDIANATFLAADAAQIFAGLTFPSADTAVVIDPPRKGCDELFLGQLFAFGPRAVVYVSCDPATQMRDLKGFHAAGYKLTAVQPFDLFPQTRHLECVITLVKK
jgi:tRNA/tmRNA/rRNA uracil-C5-methylase (TrmA/RlmC/RlmD family)